MDKKLDNEEFKVVGLDDLEVIKGDANKLKLLITSYATIMEVQDAYIKKDLEAKATKQQELEQQIASNNLSEGELNATKKDLDVLKRDVESLEESYKKFSEARQRFMLLAKKALKLPKENFEQLATEGWTKIAGDSKETIDLKSLAETQKDAQEALIDARSNDIFSSVDSNLIREEVEKMMNKDITSSLKYGDVVTRNIDADNFEETVSDISTDVEKEVDTRKENAVTPDFMRDLLSKPMEAEKEVTPESPTIEFNTDELALPEGEFVKHEKEEETTKDINPKDGVSFDKDNSILDFISKLENDTQEIKDSIEKTKDEKSKALQNKTQAEIARNEAKEKSEKAKKDVEMFKQYIPRIKELQASKKKEEETLETEMAELTSINSEREALETETTMYDEETRKSLEELREMKAILNGEEPVTREETKVLPKNVIK